MSRLVACLVLLVVLSLGNFHVDVRAQADADTDVVKLQQQLASLKSQLQEARSVKESAEAAASDAQEQSTRLTAQVQEYWDLILQQKADLAQLKAKGGAAKEASDLKAKLERIGGQLAKAEDAKRLEEDKLKEAEGQNKVLLAKLRDAEGRLSKMQELLQKAESEVKRSSQDAASLLADAENAWLPIWAAKRLKSSVERLSALLTEMQSGHLDSAGPTADKYYEAAYGTALNYWDAARPTLNRLQAAALEHYGTARSLFEKHVTSSEWWPKVQQRFSTLQSELQSVVRDALLKVDALAPYGKDPESVRLISLGVLVAPLALVLFSAVAASLAPRAPTSPDAAASAPGRKNRGETTTPPPRKSGGAKKKA